MRSRCESAAIEKLQASLLDGMRIEIAHGYSAPALYRGVFGAQADKAFTTQIPQNYARWYVECGHSRGFPRFANLFAHITLSRINKLSE